MLSVLVAICCAALDWPKVPPVPQSPASTRFFFRFFLVFFLNISVHADGERRRGLRRYGGAQKVRPAEAFPTPPVGSIRPLGVR